MVYLQNILYFSMSGLATFTTCIRDHMFSTTHHHCKLYIIVLYLWFYVMTYLSHLSFLPLPPPLCSPTDQHCQDSFVIGQLCKLMCKFTKIEVPMKDLCGYTSPPQMNPLIAVIPLKLINFAMKWRQCTALSFFISGFTENASSHCFSDGLV